MSLTPAAAFLLVRIDRDPRTTPEAFASGYNLERLREGFADLRERGLIVQTRPADGTTAEFGLTRAGCDVLGRLVEARRAHLEEMCADWSPRERAEFTKALKRLARDLVPTPQPHVSSS